jgi:hypothetical protein
MLASVLQAPRREVVIVTGYASDRIEQHIEQHYPGAGIKIILNGDYLHDVNILSVETGVNALHHPHLGYSIIETDLLLEVAAWQRILDDADATFSFWVTRGRYSSCLTGGIVHVGEDGCTIDRIAYVPVFDPNYIGWNKMVGILSVGPGEVEADRSWRREALRETCLQYYMMPWINHANDFPCKALDLDEAYAISFNTLEHYHQACASFLKNNQETI